MAIKIVEIRPSRLSEYQAVPSRFEVKAVFEPLIVDGGLGGIILRETPLMAPYIKDYDASSETPLDWPQRFDVSHWVFLLAMHAERPVGAAAVAFKTPGVFMLDTRQDLSVLWDIRVRPEARGAGILLFRYAANWSRAHGCTQMKIETQNINLPACRFYQRMGARLGEIHRFAYASIPELAHEVMLCWFLDL